MDSYRDVLAKWGEGELAADTRLDAGLVRSWRNRNSIPPDYWPAVAAAAKGRKIRGVSIEFLARLRKPRKRRDAA
jgi:hypothetical protein